MIISITMPHPPRSVSPNGSHGSWQAAYHAKKKLRKVAAWEARAAMARNLIKAGEFHPVRYRVFWHYKGTRPDADNVLARCKAILDGACDAFGVNDRSLDVAGVHPVHALHQPLCGKVQIAFEDDRKEESWK